MKQILKVNKQTKEGGWQFWVEYYENHVIKTPKNKKEIRERVKRYLKSVNKLGELDKRVQDMISDMNEGRKIIKNSLLPLKYLAYVEFLDKGKIKQRRVIILEEYILKNTLKDSKKAIDNYIDLVKRLWQYGIHEKTFKFSRNYGVLDNKVVLIDPFEITDKKQKVIKQIHKRSWQEAKKFNKHLPNEVVDYFISQADKNFTVKNLNKFWKAKLK